MIDDINFLKENSENDSISFYVDSAARDKQYWPTPAEYSLTFDQPFKFVYGFDILDAAIPTTQYNVSEKNNMVAMSLVTVPGDGSTLNTVQTQIVEIARNSTFVKIFNDVTPSRVLLLPQSAVTTYNITTISQAQPSTTTYHGFTRTVISGLTIRRKTNQHPASFFFFMYDHQEYAIEYGNTEAIDVITSSGGYHMVFSDTAGQNSIIYFTYYKLTQSLYNFLVSTVGEYIININNIRFTIEEGNYDISTLRNEINNPLNSFDVNFETTSPIETRQGRYKITSQSCFIVLNGDITTLKNNIGFSEKPTQNWTTYYTPLNIANNQYAFMSVYDSTNQVYKIEAPGLANLFGERYLVLKIKEIEDHLLGSHSYTNSSPGIGMFKLAANFNDVTNLRFDYVSLVKKPFHPIGKMTKITLRFETSKGELYDFKGVDHQLLLVIKFLIPTQKQVFQRSVLNPNYDPDFVKYFSKNRNIKYKEESDEEDHENVDIQSYRKILHDNNPASSGSGSDSDDYESDDHQDITRLLRQRTLVHS
jgi:hypothetical protein